MENKIKDWLSNRQNLIFLLIIIFAIAIRIFYFNLTKSQPVWWDESDYLAYAKNLAGLGGDWIVTLQHNSLFPFLVAALFSLGLSEVATKFILEVIPSIFIVYLTYLVSLKIYDDKRIAFISSFLMATFWVLMFNTMRFHVGAPGLLTGLLAMYVFFQGYERREKIFGKIDPKWAIPIAVLFVVLTYSIRRGYYLFGVFIFVYMLATRRWKDLLKDKYNWIGLAVFLALFFLVESFVFTSGIGEVGASYYHPEDPLNLAPLGIFSSFFALGGIMQNLSFYLFWIGIILMIVTVALYTGHIKKARNKKVLGDLFVLITILFTLLNFIFVLRLQVVGEPRWYFPLALGAFIAISRGTLLITDTLKKYNKLLAVVVIILLIGGAGYYQVQQADGIIKARISSFEGIKSASLYVKGISTGDDLVISQAVPQTIYYSEKRVKQAEQLVGIKGTGFSLEDFLAAIRENPDVKYILVSFSEPGQPDWMQRTSYGSQNGQTVFSSWEIPFMDTKIDFATGQQNVVQTKTYDDITFEFLTTEEDIFIYEVKRNFISSSVS